MPGIIRNNKALRTSGALAALGALTVLALAASVLAQVPPPPAPGPPPPDALKVFLDWPGADMDFFRGELPFVILVPSLDAADVRVSVASSVPGGKESLTLTFTGLKRFAGDDNSLTCAAEPGATPADVRREVARFVRTGLVRYIAKTPAAKHLSVEFMDRVKPTSVVDRWDFWVFNLGVDQFLDGESQYSDIMYSGKLSANRVTPALKVRISVYGDVYRQRFDVSGVSYRSSSHEYGFEGLVVKSLGDHWSAGAYLSLESSTYSNIKFSAVPAPAVEYDVFPYSESTKRQLCILYKIGYTHAAFREVTIYDKLSQGVFRESLAGTFELKRPWGTVELSLTGSHYFFRPFKYRVGINGDVSFRIWKGLSLSLDGSFTKVHDQIFLPKSGATPEEILLMVRELETDYYAYFSVGLNFRFGSLRSNVVNPRFGTGGRSVSISF